MKWFQFVMCLFLMIFVATTKVPAQDVDIYDEMTWYLKKSVVLDAARSQGRQVFFVWGRTTCAYTNGVRKNLAKEPLRSIVNEHYILWFADYEKYKRDSPEVSDYLSGIPSSVTFPAICIIDTFDVKVPHDLRLGPQNVDVLQEMLINHVSNDYVAETGVPVKVYVSGNQLIIENEVSDEMVRIFSIDGSLKG